ncbi:MAG: 3-deoxy-D-manno-octulosonic acid transferase [Aquificae bacterium]|nr:3-deoxy-D-manno-octulosonic acid transferase [Aquificota bacterium]
MSLCLRKRLLLEKPNLDGIENPIWVHCASVGEFNTFKPILSLLKKSFPIVLTYFSPRAKEFLQSERDLWDFLYPLPLDIPPLVRKFESIVKPKMLVVVERELWVSLIKFTKTKKVLVNAYAKGNFLEKLLAPHYDLILTRTEKDREVFLSQGAKRVITCGNLKLVQEGEVKRPKVEFPKGYKIFVAGSTREGEEEVILRAFVELKRAFPIVLVLAPRHMHRISEVENLIRKFGLKYSKRSKSSRVEEVLLIDTLGELKGFYSVADVTFVGGTLVPVGGHNILEPAYLGKPVLFGPYTHKVRDLEDILLKNRYGFRVLDEKDIVNVVSAILENGFSPKKDLKEVSRSVKECYLSNILRELE